MHGQMRWAGHPMGYWGGGHQMDIPMVPAPAVFLAMMVGVMVGVMIGRKKSMMHGMGPGMTHAGTAWGDWAARKTMMGEMSAHHHHGDGAPACGCGQGQTDVSERAAEE